MDFYRRVAYACQQIPVGRVATYGQIGTLCGKLRGGRQVGFALSKRVGEAVPAHRVLNHRGELSGAHAFLAEGMQQALLEQEGVFCNEQGRIDLALFGWRPSQEEIAGIQGYFLREGI